MRVRDMQRVARRASTVVVALLIVTACSGNVRSVRVQAPGETTNTLTSENTSKTLPTFPERPPLEEPPTTQAPIQITEDVPPTGLLDADTVSVFPLGKALYPNNGWGVFVDDTYYRVAVGTSLTGEGKLGPEALDYVSAPDRGHGQISFSGTIEIPNAVAPAKVEDGSGSDVTIVDGQGARYTFDLSTGTFVSK